MVSRSSWQPITADAMEQRWELNLYCIFFISLVCVYLCMCVCAFLYLLACRGQMETYWFSPSTLWQCLN